MEQLHKQGIKAADLKGVVLRHLHDDRGGGLEDLIAKAPDLSIYISREHWQDFGEYPLFASFEGATHNHWPKDFSPRIIDLQDEPLGRWK